MSLVYHRTALHYSLLTRAPFFNSLFSLPLIGATLLHVGWRIIYRYFKLLALNHVCCSLFLEQQDIRTYETKKANRFSFFSLLLWCSWFFVSPLSLTFIPDKWCYPLILLLLLLLLFRLLLDLLLRVQSDCHSFLSSLIREYTDTKNIISLDYVISAAGQVYNNAYMNTFSLSLSLSLSLFLSLCLLASKIVHCLPC